MATLIVMPRLSPTMEEGVLTKWNKQEGERVSPGDIIAEVETDKASMDFPLEDEGVLLKLLVKDGDTVKLGAPVAILGEVGEDTAALEQQARQGSVPAQAPSALPETTPAPSQEEAAPAKAAPAPAKSALATNTEPAKEPEAPARGASASPLARRLAGEAGLDIRTLRGSGPGGRVVKRDIEAALSRQRAVPALAGPPESAVVPLSMMRKTIARRLTEAKQTVPHFYLTGEARVDDLWRLREQINASLPESKISLNDLVIKATARALRRVPRAHMSFSAEGAVRHEQVDIGVAVAMDDGLITPVVRAADRKSVGAISEEVRELVERAREKKLQPAEYQGATFTVSNLGMYGVREFLAIINPPESGILAVGKVEKRPVVVEREGTDVIEIRRCMTLTLSCDHRIVDGALGAQLLAEIIKGLEQPLLLVL